MEKAKRWIVGLMIAFMFLGVVDLGEAVAQTTKLKLKMQTNLIPVDTKRVTTKFIEMISAMSGGQIEITAFPVGALVPLTEMLEAIEKGMLEMAWTAEGYWHKKVPVSLIGQGLPFAFRDLEEAKYFMFRKGFAELLQEGYAKQNVHLIPNEPYPVGLMTKKPVTKAEDLKGMKLRAYGIMADWLTKMGVSTVFIPGGELYTALATGVVEGAHWGDAGPMYIMKFQEVLKNYMNPEPIQGAWNNLLINMDVWKKLTPEQKAIIETATMGCGTFWSTNDTRLVSKRALNEMASKWNVKINTLPENEIEKMREVSIEIWDEIAKADPLSAKGITILKDFLKELGYLKK
jgi:TRAP-type mannitol/chloroaromatic compound transport system substrate-binding protein